MDNKKKVAVIMGSDSDWAVMKKACDKLGDFGVPCEAHIFSAHRTPMEAIDFAKNAKNNGFGAIIAGAGMAAHLAGVLAGNTTLPVIGVPLNSKQIGGIDSLLAVVQMPSGVPVATVAIDGAANAAFLAIQILALSDERLSSLLSDEKENMRRKVIEKDQKLQEEINK
ncbi:MAG: 5-(carboxyamino)imidazole ribonucleotide mutase [Oscillospiraceae bacterium]